ncbi:MAG: hypothetical protein R3D88_01360 [Alphaproteobacteria bacterium]|nr:hypothetical protein [Alphaproteobacteria bacterium]
MNIFQKTATAAVTTLALATPAFADATVTVCTGPNGTNCQTDRISLNRGQAVNWCVDGARVSQSVSSVTGKKSFTDALTGLYNVALRSAEAVERRGVTVTGFQAAMENCSGSWAPYCTEITVGQVSGFGKPSNDPNDLIGDLTGQPGRNCPVLGGNKYPIVAIPQ